MKRLLTLFIRGAINFIINYYILIFGITLIFLLLSWTNIKLPNIFRLKSIDLASTTLSVIVSALASILGIIIAVMLVAFEILRKSYSFYAFKTFFKDQKLRELIIIYTSTIVFSLIALISLSDPLTQNNINSISFSFLFCIISLLILFPYSKSIISSSQPKEKIKQIINKIDSSTISSFNYLRMYRPNSIYIDTTEENPIFVLSDVGIRTLKDDDCLTPQFILIECTKKLLEILKNTPDDKFSPNKRETINVFLIIIENIYIEAIKLKQEKVLRTVLDIIVAIHDFCATNKVPWHQFIELNGFIRDFLEESLETKLNNITRSGFFLLKRIMLNHLNNNTPNENEIQSLHYFEKMEGEIKHDVDKELQWNNVSEEYIRIISYIIKKAIKLNVDVVVEDGLFVLNNIISDVLRIKLGDLQKDSIIRDCSSYLKDLTIKSAESSLNKKVVNFYLFLSSNVIELLKVNKIFSKHLLISFSKTLIILNKKGVLNIYILGELRKIVRNCASDLCVNPIYKEALIYIINVFSNLRKEIENRINDNKFVYIELYQQISSLKRWMGKNKDQQIENMINEELNRFHRYNQLKSEIEDGAIKWPTLENSN